MEQITIFDMLDTKQCKKCKNLGTITDCVWWIQLHKNQAEQCKKYKQKEEKK